MSRYYPEYYYFNTSASLHETEHSDGNFSLTVNIGTCKTMFTVPSTKPCNDTVLFSGMDKTLVTATALCPAFAKEVPQDTNQLHFHQKLARLLTDSRNTSCIVPYFQDEKYIGNVLKNKGFGAFLIINFKLTMGYWSMRLYAIFVLLNSIQVNGKGHSRSVVLKKKHIRMYRTVNTRAKNGGKIGLALGFLPFS